MISARFFKNVVSGLIIALIAIIFLATFLKDLFNDEEDVEKEERAIIDYKNQNTERFL